MYIIQCEITGDFIYMYYSDTVKCGDRELVKTTTKSVRSFHCSYIHLLPVNPLMYSAFAIELSDLSKPFMFARLKGFERLENCLTKGTYERFER